MRLMLDECITPRASRLLIDALKIHKPPVEAQYLEAYFQTKGVLDPDWAMALEQEGDWSVITSDYKNPKGRVAKSKGPPLHLILPARGITAFFLGGKLAQSSGFEKARSVIYTFPELWRLAQTATPGSRYKITSTGAEGYRLSEWPLTSRLPIL